MLIVCFECTGFRPHFSSRPLLPPVHPKPQNARYIQNESLVEHVCHCLRLYLKAKRRLLARYKKITKHCENVSKPSTQMYCKENATMTERHKTTLPSNHNTESRMQMWKTIGQPQMGCWDIHQSTRVGILMRCP